MYAFDENLMSVAFHRVKAVSLALGGSLIIIDEERTKATGREVQFRIEVPYAVCRRFFLDNKKVKSFLRPMWIAIVRYGEHIVCIESHPLKALGNLYEEGVFDASRRWEPKAVQNFALLQKEVLSKFDKSEWMFDGRYVYRYSDSVTPISADGRFHAVVAEAVDFYSMASDVSAKSRTCIQYTAADGTTCVTPPIWVNVTELGTARKSNTDEEDLMFVKANNESDRVSDMMGKLDRTRTINLNWVLHAAKVVGSIYGYKEVEPLGLASLMTTLCTVNLPNLPKAVKSTFGIDMPISHALAWLMGKLKNESELKNIIQLRACIKYLLGRASFAHASMAHDQIYFEGHHNMSVPLVQGYLSNIHGQFKSA